MNKDLAKPHLKKLFAAFNKKPPDAQKEIYLDWAEKYPEATVEKTIKDQIELEDKFPTIAALHRAARKTRSQSYVEQEDCFYCDGTGFVPALFKGTPTSLGIPYIRNMACKCSSGQRHRSAPAHYEGGPRIPIEQYFEKFERPQFEAEIEQYQGYTYTQIVDVMQRNTERVKPD